MKGIAKFIIAIVMCVAFVSCDGHMPRGILVEKEHRQAHTAFHYNPVLHKTMPHHHPEQWAFVVQCDSCGKTHSCHVERAVFDKYQCGDYVEAKGCYYGKESQ